jgi:hypothetical protein
LIDFDFIDWDDAEDERGNVRHIADNGVTTGEVEELLDSPTARNLTSRSTGRPARIGWTSTGKHIIVVYEVAEGEGYTVIRPVTAYEIDP